MKVELDEKGLLRFFIVRNLKPVLAIIALVLAFLISFLNIPLHVIISYLSEASISYHLAMLTIFTCSLIYLLSIFESRQFDCEIVDNTLTLECGLIERHKKSIPLNQVSDVSMYKGIIERMIGIVVIGVQTASTGRNYPELILIAPKDPDNLMKEILKIKKSRSPAE